jgi:uncharacterized protein (UPF0276 family)
MFKADWRQQYTKDLKAKAQTSRERKLAMFTNPLSPSLPMCAGIGLRPPHMNEVLESRPSAGWFEIHAENFMNDGPAATVLERIRTQYAISIHGVGLSLGSARGIDQEHLDRLRDVCSRYEPAMVSEHVSWSVGNGIYLNDLLPLPHDEEALAIVANNISRMQDTLKRRILIENLSAYVGFARSTMSEPEFLGELAKRTGCGLLLDINNVYVSSRNIVFDAKAYIEAMSGDVVEEIHLAGHTKNITNNGPVLIDNHGSKVTPAVWALYAFATRKFGRRSTLIEWDSDVPPLETLLSEALWADNVARHTAYSRQAEEDTDQLEFLHLNADPEHVDWHDLHPMQPREGGWEEVHA